MKAKRFVSSLSAFEYAIQADNWFSKTGNNSRYVYSYDRAAPLVADGYIEIARFDAGLYYFRPTAAGLAWWYSERLRDYTARYELKAREPGVAEVRSWLDPAVFADEFEGKGIGAEVRLYVGGQRLGVFVGLQKGFFDFVSYFDGEPFLAHGPNECMTVKLTREGMAFFDSLPRLNLEFS